MRGGVTSGDREVTILPFAVFNTRIVGIEKLVPGIRSYILKYK